MAKEIEIVETEIKHLDKMIEIKEKQVASN
jgi:hypothetical protein